MRLVFLRGINHQDREPDALRVQWTWWLREALPGSGTLQQAAVEMPYYATVLEALIQGTGPGAAFAQGLGTAMSTPKKWLSSPARSRPAGPR